MALRKVALCEGEKLLALWAPDCPIDLNGIDVMEAQFGMEIRGQGAKENYDH